MQLPTAAARRRSPRLRPARFDDFEQIEGLGARYGLRRKSYEQWSRLWLGNPVYQAVADRWSIGWVLEDENDRIVGSIGNIPLWYELDGRTLLATTGHAWVAEPEYRSASLLLLHHVIEQRGVDLFINTTNSAAGSPSVSAFRCSPVPVGVWDESAFWITHYRGFVESYLALRQFPLARPLGVALSAAMFLGDRLKKRAWRRGDVEVRAFAAFDDSFDDFWTELKRRNRHRLLAVRTREMLEWHYGAPTSSDRPWIAGVVDGSRLRAYAVFDRSDKSEIGLKRVRVADFQSVDEDAALLLPLLSWALQKCRAEGIHVLEYLGRWLEKGDLVDAVASHRRRLPSWTFVYRANDPGLAETLKDGGAWAPTLYDGDASLLRN